MPAVEQQGIEPVPPEQQTAGPRDLFAINFTFLLNPVMLVLGALVVTDGGLPLPWAVLATVVGTALAFGMLVVVAEPGVDDGLSGQVAMRGTFGVIGARALTSPYRMIAATYWFATQALAGAFGVQALVLALFDVRLRVVPVALVLAAIHATLGVLGFDVMRWIVKVVLPLSIGGALLLSALFVSSDNPRHDLGRILDSPDQRFTWVGFATYVTVFCGSSLTLVTNVADFCRYTPTRQAMRRGLTASALIAGLITTTVGGATAVATGETNPFVAAVDLTGSSLVLALLLLALIVQSLAVNLTNVYTAGMSLLNASPALGRVRATVIVGAVAVALSAFPSVIERAGAWITHLGNVAAPLTGVVLADYLVRQSRRLDVPALYQTTGRYWYWHGVNVGAVLATAIGVAAYTFAPHSLLKALVGVGVGAVVYLALAPLSTRIGGDNNATDWTSELATGHGTQRQVDS